MFQLGLEPSPTSKEESMLTSCATKFTKLKNIFSCIFIPKSVGYHLYPKIMDLNTAPRYCTCMRHITTTFDAMKSSSAPWIMAPSSVSLAPWVMALTPRVQKCNSFLKRFKGGNLSLKRLKCKKCRNVALFLLIYTICLFRFEFSTRYECLYFSEFIAEFNPFFQQL